jgi:uncharacterized protein with PQ loop repeat
MYTPEMLAATEDASGLKNILGNMLLPLVLFLYSSGIPQIIDILKKKDTQGYTFMPFLFLAINAFIWTVYGFHFGAMKMLQPFLGNFWGLIVNTIYVVVYACNIKDAEVRKKFNKVTYPLYGSFIVIAIVSWIPGAQSCVDPNAMYCWTGKLVVIVNCFLFTGAFDAFGYAWRKKSVQYFPILTPCLGFCASFDCIFYFILQNDMNGLVPNVIGDMLNFSQIVFYLFIACKYPQTWKKDLEEPLVDEKIDLNADIDEPNQKKSMLRQISDEAAKLPRKASGMARQISDEVNRMSPIEHEVKPKD